MPFVRRNIGEQIQADGVVEVSGIEINQVVGTGRRNVIQKYFGQITMRINHADTVPGLYVLKGQIAQQRRLAHAGLSDDVKMLALVVWRNAKNSGCAPGVILANDDVLIVHSIKVSRHSNRHRRTRLVAVSPVKGVRKEAGNFAGEGGLPQEGASWRLAARPPAPFNSLRTSKA